MGKIKITDADRLESVQRVLSGRDSIRGVARLLGIGHLHVSRWVGLYQEHGKEGLFHRHRTYSGDFKREVIEYKKENHLSLPQTAIKFCIPGESVIIKWERIYDREGAHGLLPKKRGCKKMKTNPNKPKKPLTVEQELRRENELLKAEVAYLKKLRALVEERVLRESGNAPKPSKD